MHSRHTQTLFSVAAVAFALLSGVAAAHAQALQVSIQIVDQGGAPVPDCELEVKYEGEFNSESPAVASALSGADGIASCELPVPLAATRVSVLIVPGLDPSQTPQERARRKQCFYEIASSHTWPRRVYVPVTAGQETASTTITLNSGITADMRLVNESGVPRKAAVFVQNSPIFFGLNAGSDGRFKAYAVPASEPIRLFISSGNIEYFRQFPAATNAVGFGDIALATPTSNATLQVTLDQTDWQNTGDFYTIPGVSLIRNDASYLISFNTNAAGQIVVEFHGSDSALPIPAGTYFLVPGTFMYRPEDLRAFDLVRSGQTALVPNWPTITVAPGGTATATVHAAELDAAIRATMPPE